MSTTDRRELTDDLGILLRAALQGFQATIWTALPAIVTKYTPSAGTIECLPTIQLQQNINGVISWVDYPKLVDCPVIFPSAGGFSLTFPIAADDEVLIIFASRCIDAWFASGKNGQQNELRMHDPSDGFAIPGPRSFPRVLPALSTTNVQLRSDDGATLIEMTPSGAVNIQCANANVTASDMVNITAPEIVENGNVTINGTLTVTGNATVLDLITALLTSLDAHVHLSRTDGTALTSPPIPGT